MILTLLMTSTVLILGIFCLRKLTFGRISMRVRYALWIPVALRLLFPFSVGESSISIMNVLPAGWCDMRQLQTGLIERDTDQADVYAGGSEGVVHFEKKNSGVLGDGDTALENGGKEDAMGGDGQTAPGQRAAAVLVPGQVSGTEDADLGQYAGAEVSAAELQADLGAGHLALLRLSVCCVWLFGFTAVGGYMLLSRQRFMRYLKKNRSMLLEEALPEDFVGRLSVRGIKAYQVQGLPSPCLVGRDIYIGNQTAADQKSLPHILAHEYSHALHRDGLWAFLRCFLVAVYWFDPLVWTAAYAARQDSELACDEAAVVLLGEPERFAYGRTLLNLLENGDDKKGCLGMAYMLSRGEKGVRARIGALADSGGKKGAAAVLVLLAALALCGCAFTGAAKDTVDSAAKPEGQLASGKDKEDVAVGGEAADDAEDSENIDKSFENAEKSTTVSVETEKAKDGVDGQNAADQAAFEAALNYHGIMEGKDDSELSLNRQVDHQAYYQYIVGEAENPMENGWYLLCENKDARIALYGLYTEEFGFRGLKTLIGEDVNTFDGEWCVSLLNGLDDNIRVLDQAEDGLPRRFVWKLLAEESGTKEIWHFYYANRYDTGTVEVKMLTEEDCLAWAKKYLTFDVNKEAKEVLVTYDEDMYLGAIDISAYQDFETEDVQIVTDAVCFTLDDPGADIYQAYSDAVWEKTAVYLTAGLKFKGIEGLWFDGLPLLTVQVAEDEKGASGFRLGHPRIDETYVANMPEQERKLAELRDGISAAQAGGAFKAGENDLEQPLINDEVEGHHDLAIDFCNPCPDFERISDGYGGRTHPVTGEVRTHTGVDMAAAEGADILAAADGEVLITGFDAVNGNYVVLWHGQSGQMTYYAHCKTVEVTKGQQVAQGERIATVGQTGQATGPFLHFAISSENNWQEPYFLEIN